jgi:hypothetical protein
MFWAGLTFTFGVAAALGLMYVLALGGFVCWHGLEWFFESRRAMITVAYMLAAAVAVGWIMTAILR